MDERDYKAMNADNGIPGKEYQRLFNAIVDINGIALLSEMQQIIQIVREDFPLTTPASPTMEWVKCSDERPDEPGSYHTKIKDNEYGDVYKNVTTFTLDRWEMFNDDYEIMEWLRESSPPAPVQEGKKERGISIECGGCGRNVSACVCPDFYSPKTHNNE